MSTPCEEIRPELEALLGALPEGKLDAAGKKRLAEILKEHPEARQFYLEYCQMHALLQSAHGVLHALEIPSVARRRRLAWFAAAAALLLVAAGAVLLRDASRVDASVAPLEGSAWVVRGAERTPLSATRAVREGDRLVTGPDSRTEVKMRDGSRLTLMASTEIEIGNRVQLKEGTLRCDVTPQERPLVFQTPHAEATVLGTEFELSAGWKETRLSTTSGIVRLAAGGRSVDVKAGQVGVADERGVLRWEPLCSFDLTQMKELPPRMTARFCLSDILHTPERKIESGADRVRFENGGLVFGPPPRSGMKHGLVDLQWTEEVGEDLIVEADVAAGKSWGLGLAVSGNAFEGYRIFFAAIDDYPNGVAVDTIHPTECLILARDPRPIPYDKEHTLRLERRGRRIRAWVDGQIRIDTEINHPLAEGRKRVFSLCNFGATPLVRGLRVWKTAP
ncbi:MAG: FecR domain-containing protein [Planctomycetes bacterium]|nr:FecR domain-containing protein [Planctomycetota bacterium]